MAKMFGMFSVFLGLAIGGHVAYSYYLYNKAAPHERLAELWERDVALLRQSGKLPKGWDRVSEILYITPTPLAKKWVRQIEAPVRLIKEGEFVLEVMITDFEDKGQIGAIVQYDLKDKATGNVKWEFGRTFVLGPENLVDPKLVQRNLIVDEGRGEKEVSQEEKGSPKEDPR